MMLNGAGEMCSWVDSSCEVASLIHANRKSTDSTLFSALHVFWGWGKLFETLGLPQVLVPSSNKHALQIE